MKAYPLESISLERAMQFQFKMIDCITNEFTGSEFLTRGDLGVVAGLNKPKTTLKAEKVVAKFFDSEKAIFVRGTGLSDMLYMLYAKVTKHCLFTARQYIRQQKQQLICWGLKRSVPILMI